MDKRLTVSGVPRGEQRKLYDQRRRERLPEHGINLVILDYTLFERGARKRLRRIPEADEAVIREKLKSFLA